MSDESDENVTWLTSGDDNDDDDDVCDDNPVWMWEEDDGTWINYSPIDSSLIENAFQNGKGVASLSSGYDVNTGTNIQTNQTSGHKRNVRRAKFGSNGSDDDDDDDTNTCGFSKGDRVQVKFRGKWYKGTFVCFHPSRINQFEVQCDVDNPGVTTKCGLRDIKKLLDEDDDEVEVDDFDTFRGCGAPFDIIVISGARKYPAINQTYERDAKTRDGAPCYTATSGSGAIYFHGETRLWKISSMGQGSTANGGNYRHKTTSSIATHASCPPVRAHWKLSSSTRVAPRGATKASNQDGTGLSNYFSVLDDPEEDGIVSEVLNLDGRYKSDDEDDDATGNDAYDAIWQWRADDGDDDDEFTASSGDWREYSKSDIVTIEKAYQNRRRVAHLSSGYDVNTYTKRQRNRSTKRIREVRRILRQQFHDYDTDDDDDEVASKIFSHPLGGTVSNETVPTDDVAKRQAALAKIGKQLMFFILSNEKRPMPQEWTKIRDGKNSKLVRLRPGSIEFNGVERHFRKSMPSDKYPIKTIHRVQNIVMWSNYIHEKHQLAKKNDGDYNERVLFHGTGSVDPAKVYAGTSGCGFDSRMGSAGSFYGTS